MSFRWMSNTFIKLCDDYFSKTWYLTDEDKELLRIMCRYLLKVHWEERQIFSIFRGSRDLRNDDGTMKEEAIRTVLLIIEQEKDMSSNSKRKQLKRFWKMILKVLILSKASMSKLEMQ